MFGEEPGSRRVIDGHIRGGHRPFDVRQGERAEMTFMNPTSMMHPMHLHGHHFQVVGIGGQRFSGSVRDTVVVPAHAPVTTAFDAGHVVVVPPLPPRPHGPGMMTLVRAA